MGVLPGDVDLVDGLGGELDDMERIEDGGRVGEMAIDGFL